MAPRGVISGDGIEDGKQFSHAGGDRHLEWFAGIEKSLVHSFDCWIETSRAECRHIESTANSSPASPGGTFSSLRAAISVERRDSRQEGDLVSVEPVLCKNYVEPFQDYLRTFSHAFHTGGFGCSQVEFARISIDRAA